jgi:hypothetical protein
MNISRRELYALGEPLGDSTTRAKLGGGYVCGGGGSSSSSNQTTQNTDKRQAVDQGIAISSDSSTVNVQALDGAIVQKALDTVSVADASNAQGFGQLLGLADKLFSGAGNALQTTQAATLAQVGALTTAQNDAKGSIDQKTMTILAVAGVAAVWAFNRKK